jgi:hypothetical protein
MLNPAYQNPDRRGRAGDAHGDKTIEDEKACRFYGYDPFLVNPWGTPGGDPKLRVFTSKQLIVCVAL